MKNVVIGTAGHVDHGKTMLVKALTGKETDRLKEEKERGISIELGFAPLTLPNGQKAAIIDVPGHERFIKNMLAGVGGIDLVLFVIAADEGVMPQTKEHLDIIKLLKIQKGIVVITKCDLVEQDWLDLVQEEIKESLVDSPLESAPMVRVSTVKGQGIGDLLKLIELEVGNLDKELIFGKSKMAIDRVFSITGFGTVVTGTLTAGEFKIGDNLEVLPEKIQVKVRSIQVHGEKIEKAQAGQRVAVNLTGIEVQQVHRGSVLAEVDTFAPTYRIDCQLELLPDCEKNLANRVRVRIHLGTKEVLGRVLLLDRDELEPGENTFVQLLLEEQVVADKKDKLVVRSYSPMVTIGGGIVVDPTPGKHKRFSEKVLQNLATKLKGSNDELILQLLNQQKGVMFKEDIEKSLGFNSLETSEGIQTLIKNNQIKIITIDNKPSYLVRQNYEHWVVIITNMLESFHRKYPLRLGLNKEEVRSRLFPFLTNKVFNYALQTLEKEGILKVSEHAMSLANFQPDPVGETAGDLKKIEIIFLTQEFQPPSWEEIKNQFGLETSTGDEYLQFLLEQGILLKVGELLFHREVIGQAEKTLVNYLKSNKEISLGEARDLFKTSRKYMLPVLEYFDRVKVTRRQDEKRVLFRVR